MERSEAAFQAFDGVRLTLADGRVVQVPAFTTREALGYLRLLSRAEAGDVDAHHAFLKALPARADLLEVPLSAFEFSFDVLGVGEVNGGDVTVAEAIGFAETLAAAQGVAVHACGHCGTRAWEAGTECGSCGSPDQPTVEWLQPASSQAQIRFLDDFPGPFGLQELRPPDVFAAGNRFVEELFLLLYGIARSFLSRLISPAEIKAMTMAGTGSGSTPASPT